MDRFSLREFEMQIAPFSGQTKKGFNTNKLQNLQGKELINDLGKTIRQSQILKEGGSFYLFPSFSKSIEIGNLFFVVDATRSRSRR